MNVRENFELSYLIKYWTKYLDYLSHFAQSFMIYKFLCAKFFGFNNSIADKIFFLLQVLRWNTQT